MCQADTHNPSWRLAAPAKIFTLYLCTCPPPSEGPKVFIEDAWLMSARGLHSRAVGIYRYGRYTLSYVFPYLQYVTSPSLSLPLSSSGFISHSHTYMRTRIQLSCAANTRSRTYRGALYTVLEKFEETIKKDSWRRSVHYQARGPT